ncbi:hypothetical protein, partial [Enterococcus faecalis]
VLSASFIISLVVSTEFSTKSLLSLLLLLSTFSVSEGIDLIVLSLSFNTFSSLTVDSASFSALVVIKLVFSCESSRFNVLTADSSDFFIESEDSTCFIDSDPDTSL